MSAVESSIHLRPGQGEVLVPNLMVLKTAGNQTGGAFEVLEVRGPGGPPLHIHHRHHELFQVLEGVFSFTVGNETFDAGSGSFVLVPPGTPHAFSAQAGARASLVVAPAGLAAFFAELAAGMAAGKADEEIRRGLEGKYDQHPV